MWTVLKICLNSYFSSQNLFKVIGNHKWVLKHLEKAWKVIDKLKSFLLDLDKKMIESCYNRIIFHE